MVVKRKIIGLLTRKQNIRNFFERQIGTHDIIDFKCTHSTLKLITLKQIDMFDKHRNIAFYTSLKSG